jgi:hypothetical protein
MSLTGPRPSMARWGGRSGGRMERAEPGRAGPGATQSAARQRRVGLPQGRRQRRRLRRLPASQRQEQLCRLTLRRAVHRSPPAVLGRQPAPDDRRPHQQSTHPQKSTPPAPARGPRFQEPSVKDQPKQIRQARADSPQPTAPPLLTAALPVWRSSSVSGIAAGGHTVGTESVRRIGRTPSVGDHQGRRSAHLAPRRPRCLHAGSCQRFCCSPP